MRQLRRGPGLRRFSPRLVASVSALAFLLPVALDASTASAAPSPGYTASYIAAGTGVTQAVAVNSVTDTIYLADSAGQLVVINGASDAVVTTLTISTGGVSGVAVDSATNTVYALVAGPEVAVINGATNTVSATISVPAGVVPDQGIAVDSATDLIYVTDQADNSGGAASGGGVFVIDGSTNAVVSSFSSGGGDPEGIAVDESTDVVWVANMTGTVTATDGATGTTIDTVSVTGIPESIAVDPVTDTVYVASESNGGLAVIDGADGLITTTVAVGSTNEVAVDSANDVVFARGAAPGTTATGTVVIDGTDNAVVNTVGRAGARAAVDSATGSVYLTTSAPDGLWVVTSSAVDAMSPIIDSSASATFTAGTAGSFSVSASALPAATLSESGALPSGVTFGSSGTLSGTPAAGTGGVYPITITASNGIAPDYPQAFTLTVDEVPTLTIPTTTTFQVGAPVTMPIPVTGDPTPTVQLLTVLPPGVELTETASGSWELSGTPETYTAGVYPAEFGATNAVGTVTATVDITVLEAPIFEPGATATFQSDASNSGLVVADCNPACTYSGSGLPSGLTLASSGVLSGDTHAGTYSFTVTASNDLGAATETFTVTVQQSVAFGVAPDPLLAQAPQLGNGWADLGGVLSAAPAVAAVPTPDSTTAVAPLFIAPGTNKELWMYSVSAGWQPVGPSQAYCIGSAAAVVTGSTLTVACEGLNRQLYYNTATLPASGIPTFTGPWISLGGILSAGPAVAPVGGVLTFFAEGTNGQVFTNTGSGYTATPWYCIGHLAAATDASTGITTFACQGGDHSLWTATNPGTGWSAAQSLGGQLIDGPGIAAGGGVTDFFAEGTNESAYEWTATSGWTDLRQAAFGGAGAVALN